MKAFIAPVVVYTQRYQCFVVALTPSTLTQMMKLDRSGFVVAIKVVA
jgi:hypothetical protein